MSILKSKKNVVTNVRCERTHFFSSKEFVFVIFFCNLYYIIPCYMLLLVFCSSFKMLSSKTKNLSRLCVSHS